LIETILGGYFGAISTANFYRVTIEALSNCDSESRSGSAEWVENISAGWRGHAKTLTHKAFMELGSVPLTTLLRVADNPGPVEYAILAGIGQSRKPIA
jgi:hypothetical protein